MKETDYSPSLLAAIKVAKSVARGDEHTTFGVAHIATALFIESTGLQDILSSMGKDVGYIMEWFEMRKEMYTSSSNLSTGGEILADNEVAKVMEEAERSKIKLGTDYIDSLCLFTAIVREGVVYSEQQITSLDITEKDILTHFNAPATELGNVTIETELASSAPYLVNLKTEEVLKEGALILGREQEVRTMLENLERSENKGTLLVGDSGVGKTAILKSFVKEVAGNRDELVQNTSILSLNIPKLLASSSGSENEISKKIVDLFEKLNKQETQTVLVIDDLQVLLENATKSNLITNILSAQLSDGSVNLILTMTTDAYRKNLEKHPIKNKLEVLLVEELEHFLLEKCIERHLQRLKLHYQLDIANNVINEAIHLSKRYFKENKLPLGAINLLDRTFASTRLSNKNSETELKKISESLEILEKTDYDISDLQLILRIIFKKMSVILTSKLPNDYNTLAIDSKEEALLRIKIILSELLKLSKAKTKTISTSELEAVVAENTGIPIGKIQAEEKERLLGIEQKLQERVKGQSSAINTLSDAIIESRSGLSNPKQPIGSFFFLGPTGTGKTELTKALAELLFDDESAMIRFDMSEFKEEHSAALLYGAPPGYVGYEEGGMLVNKIRQKPYSVVLFDEIEKAHGSVYDVFLQIMDEGTIHDKLGRDGDFSNSIVIFTSNIGSQWITEQIENGSPPTSNELIEVMAQHFRPEFLGRLTEVVPFSPIGEDVAKEIFTLHFSNLQAQLLKQKNITLNLSEEALEHLTQKGYSKKYGARPIAGVIRTFIKKNISRLIVGEQVKSGDVVELNYKDGNLCWELC